MPKDSFLIGTPPNHSSNHFSRIPTLQEEKKYERIDFTRLLGRGTFSQVYLSLDKKSGESLAVKMMDMRRFEEEFNSEVSIMMKLTQKGVNVNFLSSEVDEDNDTGYIYMNYIPFPTLSEFLVCFWLDSLISNFFFFTYIQGKSYFWTKRRGCYENL